MTAMLMLSAIIPRDHIFVFVIMDTQEMEKHVMVRLLLCIISWQHCKGYLGTVRDNHGCIEHLPLYF